MAVLNLWNMDADAAAEFQREAGGRNMTQAQYAERLLSLHKNLKTSNDQKIVALLEELELQPRGV